MEYRAIPLAVNGELMLSATGSPILAEDGLGGVQVRVVQIPAGAEEG